MGCDGRLSYIWALFLPEVSCPKHWEEVRMSQGFFHEARPLFQAVQQCWAPSADFVHHSAFNFQKQLGLRECGAQEWKRPGAIFSKFLLKSSRGPAETEHELCLNHGPQADLNWALHSWLCPLPRGQSRHVTSCDGGFYVSTWLGHIPTYVVHH